MINPGRCWSDLPDLLMLLIVLRLPDLTDLLSFAAVCSSWRRFIRSDVHRRRIFSRFLSSHPPLLFFPYSRPSRFRSVVRSDAAGSFAVTPSLDKSLQVVILGCSHGHVIVQIIDSDPDIHLIICDPFTGREISPPPPPPDVFPSVYYAATLSAPPDDKSCFLILFTRISIVYRRLAAAGPRYAVYPIKSAFMVASILPFTDRERVYAISSYSMSLVEIKLSNKGGDGDELGIKIHSLSELFVGKGKQFDVQHFGPQLAEFNGELLVVVLVANSREYDGQKVLKWVQVFRMDLEKMQWRSADRVLEDCSLFVCASGGGAQLVPEPEQWGGSCSRLYVALPKETGWREFGLIENGLLMPEYPSPLLVLPANTLRRWWRPVWMYPSFLY